LVPPPLSNTPGPDILKIHASKCLFRLNHPRVVFLPSCTRLKADFRSSRLFFSCAGGAENCRIFIPFFQVLTPPLLRAFQRPHQRQKRCGFFGGPRFVSPKKPIWSQAALLFPSPSMNNPLLDGILIIFATFPHRRDWFETSSYDLPHRCIG